ncbi:MAG: EamA family transporter [Clostridium sp.]
MITITYICLLIMTLTGAFASLFLKQISEYPKKDSKIILKLEERKNNSINNNRKTIITIILNILKNDIIYPLILLLENIYLYYGGILYILAAILNIFVLKYLEYSIVLPLTAITYIWTMLISKIYLKEKITKLKILGIILIVIGSYLITIS